MSIFSKKTTDTKKEAAPKAEVKAAPVKAAPAKASAPKAAQDVTASLAAGNPKTLKGVVVSTKMKDTIVVKVDRFVKVPKYERFMKISKKYKAHDAGNTKKEGEIVTIVETRPISKDKNFKVAA